MAYPTQTDHAPEILDERTGFLSGPPRSGELSPAAQKIAAVCFIWLCSVVVFGSAADFASSKDARVECESLCHVGIAWGVCSFLGSSILLILHYLTWTNTLEKSPWFSAKAQVRYMLVLSVWWTVGVACLSALKAEKVSAKVSIALPNTSLLAIMFGWLAFFSSIFGAYKAYHSQREEQKAIRFEQIQSLRATEEEEYANFT